MMKRHKLAVARNAGLNTLSRPYDSQETALLSAIDVADAIVGPTARRRALRARAG